MFHSQNVKQSQKQNVTVFENLKTRVEFLPVLSARVYLKTIPPWNSLWCLQFVKGQADWKLSKKYPTSHQNPALLDSCLCLLRSVPRYWILLWEWHAPVTLFSKGSGGPLYFGTSRSLLLSAPHVCSLSFLGAIRLASSVFPRHPWSHISIDIVT